MDESTMLTDLPEAHPQVFAPGMVLIKRCLSRDQQIWLAQYAMKTTSNDGPHRFTTVVTAKLEFFTDAKTGQIQPRPVIDSNLSRGRVYSAITTFPEANTIRKFCDRLVSVSRNADVKMPAMQPTHLLLLYYASGGMTWHKDDDTNDGDNDHPIVSISLGNSSQFGYKLPGKPEQFITLESGDVLIWGGPSRMLLHCVGEVHLDTCPEFLTPIIGNARLNFTFRDAPNILGDEEKFKYTEEQLAAS
jgi:alkylated DNA repair dioxygenase AlkB